MPIRMRAILVRGALVTAVLGLLAAGAWSLLRSPVRYTASDPSSDAPASDRDAVAAVTPPPRPSSQYVGSQACADCHAEVFELYQSHPMSRSLAHVREAPPIEDYTDDPEFLFPPSTHVDVRVRYYVEKGENCDYHHEVAFLPGEDDELYDKSVPVHYEVGSGQRGRSYLMNRDGLLFMSPITWYSEKQRWDMSPGYIYNNRHFERRILDGCVTCHAGRMASVEGRRHCFEPTRPFLEEAIGCERCHGPGAEHVAYHSGETDEGAIDPIVNPIDLEPRQRDAACFQCHLAGEERIPRYGRTHYDFRPGDRLIDIWTVFVKGTGMRGDQTTGAVSQVEQMLASRCYNESSGRLGCVSCHDPHSIPTAESRVTFYRERCLDCHAHTDPECSLSLERRLEVTAEDSCIDCHMPRIAANDVPHTSQTDHRVLRTYDERSSAVRETGLQILEDGPLPEAERDRALGMMLAMRAEQYREFRVFAGEAISKLEPWVAAVPDDHDAAELLGAAYLVNDDVDSAYTLWKRVLDADPDNEDILRRLVVTCHEYDRYDEGVEYARRLVELNPWDHMHHGRLAHMLAQRGELEEAIRAGERAAELRPSDFWVHGWLAEVYRLAGKPELAEPHETLRALLAPQERP